MESPTEVPIPLYETLPVLPLSSSNPTSPSPQPPHPCTVLRNQISLDTVPLSDVEEKSADFLLLDAVHDEEIGAGFRTPSGESKLSGNSGFESRMLQLHKEIVDFCDFLSPTLEEQASRRAAVQCVSDVIKSLWPSSQVEVFGSFRTGLYLPTSDIDVVILGSYVGIPQTGLRTLSVALSQRGIAKNIQVIANARVPIIKFVEKRSGVSFDISFEMPNGPRAADFVKDAVERQPSLRPLCLILKIFLRQRGLSEVYTGGISSYALLIMLMAVLKNQNVDGNSPDHNLGVLLVQFFDTYGRKLNLDDVGVSWNGFFPKRRQWFMNYERPSLICVEDPQAPGKDIGKSSFNFAEVRLEFAMAFSSLTNPNRITGGLGGERSILGTIIRADPVLEQRKGGRNGDVTFKSLFPEAGESQYHLKALPPRGNKFGEDLSIGKRKWWRSTIGKSEEEKRWAKWWTDDDEDYDYYDYDHKGIMGNWLMDDYDYDHDDYDHIGNRQMNDQDLDSDSDLDLDSDSDSEYEEALPPSANLPGEKLTIGNRKWWVDKRTSTAGAMGKKKKSGWRLRLRKKCRWF